MKSVFIYWDSSRKPININMRCIEIQNRKQLVPALMKININMRCIEIGQKVGVGTSPLLININMRCIEMCLKMDLQITAERLTLT